MNSKLYRLVFSRSRGTLVAAAENVASSGKSGAGESSGGSGAPAAASVLAGLALAAGSAFGQALPTGASVQQGAAQVSTSGASMIVRQTTPRLVSDWQSFSIGAGNSVQFVQPSSASVALNRVTGNQASAIFGSLTANGHVYLQNPAGVLFAPGAKVNVGALVATTLRADLNAFRAGELRLSGGEASTGAVVNQGSITTPTGGHVVLAGPQVSNAGSISTPLGTTALAAGSAVNVDPTGSGLMSISIPVAAIGAHLSNSGSITADGGLVALQAAATDAALRSVMQVGGVVRARSIEQRDGQIVLAGGTSGVVAVTGTLDASGAAGTDTRGGSIKVLGERVALLGNARLDASGDTGGGTVLVGGNYQGNGPEANALDTYLGAGTRIDASARRSGDGGTAIVWSDHHTDYRGHIEATGGRDGGDGGMAEVSGKQSLNFGGTVNLSAARGHAGNLLLDPSTIDIGLVSDIDGNGTTGDDITDSVSPSGPSFYNVDYADFSGAASRISASRLATLLFDNQVTLKATSSILVSAPITVTAATSNRTLSLWAPTVTVNAAVDMGLGYLELDTRQSFSDSIRINAPVKAYVANLTSSDIGISAPVDVNTLFLNAAPSAPSVITSTGGVRANNVIVSKAPSLNSALTLTGNNNIHILRADASSATVNVVQGDQNNGGFILDTTNVSGNLNLTVAGTSVYQFDGIGFGIKVGGQFNVTLTDPQSVRPQVFVQNAQNSFGSVVFSAPGNFFLDGSAGPLSVQGTAGGNITLLNTNQVTSLTGNITSTGVTGNTTTTILGVGFDNSANAQVVVQPGSDFVIISRDYTKDVLGSNLAFGFGPADINYVVFNAYSGSVSSNGNFYYTNQAGTLTAPQSDLPAVSKVYDGSTSFSLGYFGNAATGTLTASQPETATRLANDGAGFYTAFGSGNFANKNVGIDKGYTTSAITNTALFGSSGVSYLGLVIGSYVRPPGPSAINPVSEVTPKDVLVTGVTAANKVYDGTTLASAFGATVTGLLVNDIVGLAGGSPTANFSDKNVGTGKTVTVTGYSLAGSDAFNYTLLQPTGVTANITPATLAVSGIGALDKVYDTTTVATLTGTGSVAPIGSDVVTLGGSGSGGFTNKNVGANKPVIVTGFTLGGADAGNYLIQQPSGVLANITPASLSISGLTAANKAYDATTVATLIGTAVATPLAGDSVTLGGTGTGAFASKNVGTAKPVTVTGYTLGGADAGNYLLGAPPGLVADITAINLAVTGITALDKTYDATTAAQLAGNASVAPIAGDAVSAVGSGVGTFNNKNVGTAKAVTVSGYTLTGADAANYLIVQPTGASASIVPASLTVSGITAADKVYDATTVATLTGTAVAVPLGSDAVSITGGSGVGAFANKNVGTDKAVTVTGYTLSGADAGNYTLGQPTGLSASITPSPLILTGVTVADKVYDGTVLATLTGIALSTAPYAGDSATFGGGSFVFVDKNVGVNKSVVASGFSLTGADAANYSVTVANAVTASITPRALTVGGLTALDKVYDSTTVAQLAGTATLSNAVSGDAIALSGSNVGSFADKNVGTAKPVTSSSFALVGTDAGNYTLTQPAGLSASITQYTLALNGVFAADKVYDTTTVASLSGTPTLNPFAGDVVSFSGGTTGTFADKNVGLDKPVTLTAAALTGADAGNYRLVAPSGGLTADITARVLTPTGISAVPRGATSSTDVTLDTAGAALSGVLAGDTVALVTSGATGSVSSPDAGTNKTVAVSGLALAGLDARNYALSVGTNGLPNSVPLLLGITVTLFSPLRQTFDDLRDKEYLQGVSDAQEPFRRAMAEALAAGFGKENIRKQLQRGLVFETGLAAPAVDTIEPARKPASCTPGAGATSALSC